MGSHYGPCVPVLHPCFALAGEIFAFKTALQIATVYLARALRAWRPGALRLPSCLQNGSRALAVG